MKEFRFRIVVILGFLALSIYLLYPTFADYQNTKDIEEKVSSYKETFFQANPNAQADQIEEQAELFEDSLFNSDPSFREDREKRVKLGLDLQGGMYIVMEVNTSKLLERLAKDSDELYKTVLKEAEEESKLSDENLVSILARKLQERNVRLSRYFGSIREDDADIISNLQEQESDAVTRAIEIIRNRVDQYGVSEPSIQKQGARRIIVELPGIAKEEEAKRLLQGSALLEFKLLRDPEFTFQIMNQVNSVLANSLISDSSEVVDNDTSLAQNDSTSENLSEEEFAKKNPFFSLARLIDPQGRTADAVVRDKDRQRLLSYLNRPEVQNVIPNNVEFAFGAKPFGSQDGEEFYTLYLVNKGPELTGGVIADAQATIDPNTTEPVVNMQMNSDGAREWARITGSNVGKRCAVMLDGYIYTAPTIQEKIPSGSSRISGMGDLNEAKLLEIVLKAGALPAPVEIIEERTVGPSLGQDSISQGFNSTMLGFLLVAIFMIVYYKKAGTIADLALFFTIMFIMGILAGFNATLTLPGIAGIILTIGMAVDANVIIYERIREELATGKTVKAAIDSGFVNSYSAIFDSNITTFFTGIILYQFGSGPIQGFALTLMIGILSSLFSALVVTRVVFDIMAAKGAKIKVG
ncbi:MAG: protein translocase subunit SecD [Bacteroidetes bacterium]|nr:protein translocase subunit SecD [Bacteroidota bacterium]